VELVLESVLVLVLELVSESALELDSELVLVLGLVSDLVLVVEE